MMQDVQTHWNSTYSMLECINEQQASICAALVELKRIDLMLNDEDMKILEKLLEVLQPFMHITETMCGEKYTTVSSIKPLLHHLLNVTLAPNEGELGAIKHMKEVMAHNLASRYQVPEVNKILNVSLFPQS